MPDPDVELAPQADSPARARHKYREKLPHYVGIFDTSLRAIKGWISVGRRSAICRRWTIRRKWPPGGRATWRYARPTSFLNSLVKQKKEPKRRPSSSILAIWTTTSR